MNNFPAATIGCAEVLMTPGRWVKIGTMDQINESMFTVNCRTILKAPI